MAGAGDKAHLIAVGHFSVGGLGLHGAAGIEGRPLPLLNAARRSFGVAAEGALVGFLFLLEAIEVVGKKFLRQGSIDLAFVLLHELVPAGVAGVHGAGGIVGIVGGFFLDELRVAGEIGAYEVAIFGTPHAMIFQAELEARDFAGLAVGEKPIVGVATVVALEHDAHVIVDGVGILQRFAGAHEFRGAGGIEAGELRDGGFGD